MSQKERIHDNKQSQETLDLAVCVKRFVICGLRIIVFVILSPLVAITLIGERCDHLLTCVFDKLPKIPKKALSVKSIKRNKERKQRKINQLFPNSGSR